MNGEPKVNIYTDCCSLGHKVTFYSEFANELYIAEMGDKGILAYHPHERGVQTKHPTLELTRKEMDAFIKAIIESKIEIESETLLKGKYDRTLKHLDDMRAIVGKQLNVKLIKE